jgi:shikimate dehydrogenase
MHNAAFAALGLDWIYVPWAVPPDGLWAAVDALRRLENFGGANATVPHKERVMEALDAVTPAAEAIGAVNTLVARDGRLTGHNTDAAAFLGAVREEARFEPAGRSVVLLGAGGAARAVAWILGEAGVARLAVANRTLRRAELLAFFLQKGAPGCAVRALALDDPALRGAVAESDLLVNATAAGLEAGDPPPVNPAWLRPGQTVVDLIYGRPTALLRAAAGAGCRPLDGLGRQVRQGALAFELWTGAPAPLGVMRAAAQHAEVA